MAYAGEVLNQCGLISVDLSSVTLVAVSGDGPNVCGHLLLQAGNGAGGIYFHVAEFHGPPRYMTADGYQRYLREAGKMELRRVALSLPNPQGAMMFLEKIMSEDWLWLALPNNCVTFVEEVIKAGGGKWSSMSNCPSVATQETLAFRAQQLLMELENSIYRAYGVPRR
jgi:hypothetical protein